jgi:hypothetical protein
MIECTHPRDEDVTKAVQTAFVKYLKEAKLDGFKLMVSEKGIIPSAKIFEVMAMVDFGQGGSGTKEQVEAEVGKALELWNNTMKERNLTV